MYLSPPSLSSNLVLGGSNTLYASLIHFLVLELLYGPNTLVELGYDWRLSPKRMQLRDNEFTRWKQSLEAARETSNRPGVVIAHSLGNLVFRSFVQWLEVRIFWGGVTLLGAGFGFC